MTLSDIKKQADEMLQIKENTARYREQVEQLEKEIQQLEKEVTETLDFEKDMKLQDKKDRLPTFKKRLKEAEKKEEAELRDRGMKLNNIVSRYQKDEMEADTEAQEAYKEATESLAKAYEAIQAYEDTRAEKANEILAELVDVGYNEAMKNSSLIPITRMDQVLSKAPTKINLTKGTGNGRHQSAEQFFAEVLNTK